MRACLRVSGSHDDDRGKMFRYVARVHAWRGQPYVRVFYTFINDRQETLMAKIRQLWSCSFLVPLGGGDCVCWTASPSTGERLFQVDENQYLLDGKPAGRQRLRLGRRRLGQRRLGRRPARVLAELAQGDQRAEPGRHRPGTLPRTAQGPLRRQAAGRGEQALLRPPRRPLHVQGRRGQDPRVLDPLPRRPSPTPSSSAQFFQATEEPLLAVAEPAYASATKALGEFPPADPARSTPATTRGSAARWTPT